MRRKCAEIAPGCPPSFGWVTITASGNDRARLLCARLAEQGMLSTELIPVSEAGELGGPSRGSQRPARWSGGAADSFGARRSPAIGFHLTDGGLGVAVRETALVSLQPHPGNARLILDSENGPRRILSCASNEPGAPPGRPHLLHP
ncbi:hypothetical protein IM697_24910 [Streptomyces ferrugineus]|uniref:Uncharacterized protein n=1 Tax=Streptomyces ferrugineus TaxID=1413221 RepID=A0A7M2SE51_9ACTN|nr:hypothetical protein [Streptomyces ferrugineus]QOV33451.1 hypothetical protein IM697_24910 [Streptomyces ferrugineus]